MGIPPNLTVTHIKRELGLKTVMLVIRKWPGKATTLA
jgi:hypothetical protein